MSAKNERSHLYVVGGRKVKELSQEVALPNTSTITLSVVDGRLVSSQVNARLEDCLELLNGLLIAQTAVVRKMQGA
ncbi:hypothetical protein [Burkholderia anthina]|uniref:hypothetical protein n=1 Tax=Burkholderia anthina TaxID=179879 RepID=UPI001589D22E|nr:hypothetical protein [Burkholderia anthina]